MRACTRGMAYLESSRFRGQGAPRVFHQQVRVTKSSVMNRPSRSLTLASILLLCPVASLTAAESAGLGLNLGTLYRVSNAKSRSISPENFTGEKGKAGMAKEGTGKNASRELG